MSVAVESRSKRNFPKPVINKTEKIKKKSNCNFSDCCINESEIEFDCGVSKNEDFLKNSKKECIDSIQGHSRVFDIAISANEAVSLFESSSCCIVDVRDCRTHQNGHIKNSNLFNCQKRLLTLKAKKSWDMFSEKFSYEFVVIYNQKGDKTPLVDDFIEHIMKDFDKVFYIKGGFEEFLKCADKRYIKSAIPEDIYDQYHYSPTNELTKSTDVLNAVLSEILPFLFLGNEIDSKDLDLLRKKKITHILNVTTNIPFSHEGQFVYKRLSATDSNKQDMRPYYNEAFNFIDEAKAQNGKVLVHCWAGVSRSATIVAAYVLNHTRLSVLQTVSFLQSKRSIVEPNFNFLGQLERYYCDLEKGIESRSPTTFKGVEELAKKILDLNRVKDLSLSGESSNSVSPASPVPTKPYFNFIK